MRHANADIDIGVLSVCPSNSGIGSKRLRIYRQTLTVW